MSLRLAIAVAMLVGSTVAASGLPLDQPLKLPSDDATAQKKDSSDGLYDHSMPDRWDNANSSSHSDSSDLGKFHFTVRGSEDNGFTPRSSYGDAKTPMSEFYGPTPPQNDNTDPLLDH
jgi:hypothetical protein